MKIRDKHNVVQSRVVTTERQPLGSSTPSETLRKTLQRMQQNRDEVGPPNPHQNAFFRSNPPNPLPAPIAGGDISVGLRQTLLSASGSIPEKVDQNPSAASTSETKPIKLRFSRAGGAKNKT